MVEYHIVVAGYCALCSGEDIDWKDSANNTALLEMHTDGSFFVYTPG